MGVGCLKREHGETDMVDGRTELDALVVASAEELAVR